MMSYNETKKIVTNKPPKDKAGIFYEDVIDTDNVHRGYKILTWEFNRAHTFCKLNPEDKEIYEVNEKWNVPEKWNNVTETTYNTLVLHNSVMEEEDLNGDHTFPYIGIPTDQTSN